MRPFFTTEPTDSKNDYVFSGTNQAPYGNEDFLLRLSGPVGAQYPPQYSRQTSSSPRRFLCFTPAIWTMDDTIRFVTRADAGTLALVISCSSLSHSRHISRLGSGCIKRPKVRLNHFQSLTLINFYLFENQITAEDPENLTSLRRFKCQRGAVVQRG
jgi:hypothetical protein